MRPSSLLVVLFSWLAVLGISVLALPARAQEAPGSFAAEGTWHVLVHYKDSQAHNKDAERWQDRVWVFAREGDRLRWTEYPIVVFDDKTGRFERSSTNRAARTLHYWEPNAAQLAELASGPKANARGSRSKRLRGSDADGWRSTNVAGAASASVITFTATWSIEDPAGLPIFRMEDVMGSGLSDTLEGGTVYETESLEEGGRLLRGRYDRDGARVGRFVARRTADKRGLGSRAEQEKRISAKLRQNFIDQYLGGDATLGMANFSEGLARQAREGTLSAEDRRALRGEIRSKIEAGVRARGLSISSSRKGIEALTRKIEKLMLEGSSPQEIEQLYREGKLRP